MRNVLFATALALMICCGFAPASEGFDDLVNRARAGATEEALVTFAQKSGVAYDLTVDEIFILSDLGYTAKSIAAVIESGKAVAAGGKAVEAAPKVAQVEAEKPAPLLPPVAAQEPAPIQNQAPIQNPALEKFAEQPAPVQPAVANEQPAPPQIIVTTAGERLQIDETVNLTIAPNTVVVPPEGEASIGTFYQALAPYGSWVRINDAWYWRPTACVTDPNWRPYCDRGHWVWTDNNWFWHSDYSWGWAPFHYGRWMSTDGYGWLWMPDTCWSPAWVSWRECDGHYGWAPLPCSARYDVGLGFRHAGRHWWADIGFGLGMNDYCFCPCDHFYGSSLRQHVLHRKDNHHIFNTSRLLQHDVSHNNNCVTVNGPHFDHVQKYTGVQIKPVSLMNSTVKAGEPLGRAFRDDPLHQTMHVYRPTIKESTTFSPTQFVSKVTPGATNSTVTRPSIGNPTVIARPGTSYQPGTKLTNPITAGDNKSGATSSVLKSTPTISTNPGTKHTGPVYQTPKVDSTASNVVDDSSKRTTSSPPKTVVTTPRIIESTPSRHIPSTTYVPPTTSTLSDSTPARSSGSTSSSRVYVPGSGTSTGSGNGSSSGNSGRVFSPGSSPSSSDPLSGKRTR
ncbi:MAG: DUF6600 domain-containing protein [Planctomycetota bacterium]